MTVSIHDFCLWSNSSWLSTNLCQSFTLISIFCVACRYPQARTRNCRSTNADTLAFCSVITHEPSQSHAPGMAVQQSVDMGARRNTPATLQLKFTHRKRWHKHIPCGIILTMDGRRGTILRSCTNDGSMLALAARFTR